MAFLFETRTLGSIVSSVASEATTTTSLAPDSTSPTLTALLTLETATTTLAPVILSTVSTSVAKILETTTTTEDPGFFDGVSTMTNEDSTLARIVEMFNEKPESLGLQDVMFADNNTNTAISIVQLNKMEANIETLNANLNHLFLLINGSLVILMQVNIKKFVIISIVPCRPDSVSLKLVLFAART